ncbi:DUF2946 family protein [Bradyrhizobium valentinum]|uniref:DUF2946 family protein n=1 Tax=Bradyrhizobium valentinum TaxID=1518501 RepID=UPI003B839F07
MVAAFIAAYALVFNVILSSVLAAGLAPTAAAAAHVLCVNSADADAARNDAGKSGQKIAIHCPLCVGHLITGALPPPQPTLCDRLPVQTCAVFAFVSRFVAHFRSFDHQSRGPPRLS